MEQQGAPVSLEIQYQNEPLYTKSDLVRHTNPIYIDKQLGKTGGGGGVFLLRENGMVSQTEAIKILSTEDPVEMQLNEERIKIEIANPPSRANKLSWPTEAYYNRRGEFKAFKIGLFSGPNVIPSLTPLTAPEQRKNQAPLGGRPAIHKEVTWGQSLAIWG